MTDVVSIARPYALAAFEFAQEKQDLHAWQAFLQTAADFASHEDVTHLLKHPALSATQASELFADYLVEIDTSKRHFLALLAEKKRLLCLPEIACLFNAHLAALEKACTVRVVTAVPMSADFSDKLSQILSKRLGNTVTLTQETDPTILGGAVIHMGDQVIDGSIQNKLSTLLDHLTV